MNLGELRARFGDRFSSAWVLLSDTDRFLSRARLMPRYERRVREWRQRLQECRGDPAIINEIRSEIVAVRRSLREQGYELRLGSTDIELRGFRSDDAMASGFRRMVLYMTEDGAIYHTVGDANHIVLDQEMRGLLQKMSVAGPMRPHYLWYRVTSGLIELAGADSEVRESYEELQQTLEERKSDLVKALRRLR